MTAEILREAEVLKLARTLNANAQALDVLAALDGSELRALREQLTQRLFDEHSDLFRRLARSGRLLPATVMARLSEKIFGPLISARTAGLMAVDKAVAIAKVLTIEFQAELSIHLDPRSAPELLRAMPVDLIVRTARVLCDRREFITMGRFVDNLTDEAISAVTESIPDPEALVQIGFYVESSDALSRVIEILPSERLRETVRLTTQGVPELQQAGVAMLSTVHDPVKGLMGDAAAFQGDALMGQLVKNLRDSAGDVLEAMAANLSPDGRAAYDRVCASGA